MAPFQKGKSGNPKGRPSNRDKHQRVVDKAEGRIAQELPNLTETQIKLAQGGLTETAETWEPAATILIDVPFLTPDGEVAVDKSGKPQRIKRLAFPDVPPDELVLVKRTVTTLAPDRAAGHALMDRIMGRATPSEEAPEAERRLAPDLLRAISKAYPDDDAV